MKRHLFVESRLMPRAGVFLVSFILFSFESREVSACSYCQMAISEYVFPPAMSWALIIVIWQFGQGLISTWTKETFRFQFSVLGSIGCILIVGFIGAIMMGPMLIPLLLPGPVAAFVLVVNRKKCRFGERARSATLYLGSVMVAALVVTAVWDYAKASKMTRVDYIKKWNGVGLERMLIEQMGREGAAALPEWKRIMRESDSYDAWMAMDVIDQVSPDENQMPLLLETYRRIYRPWDKNEQFPSMSEWQVSMFEAQMKSYSGLDLPS